MSSQNLLRNSGNMYIQDGLDYAKIVRFASKIDNSNIIQKLW